MPHQCDTMQHSPDYSRVSRPYQAAVNSSWFKWKDGLTN